MESVWPCPMLVHPGPCPAWAPGVWLQVWPRMWPAQPPPPASGGWQAAVNLAKCQGSARNAWFRGGGARAARRASELAQGRTCREPEGRRCCPVVMESPAFGTLRLKTHLKSFHCGTIRGSENLPSGLSPHESAARPLPEHSSSAN